MRRLLASASNPAAWPRNSTTCCRFANARRRESCIAAFLAISDVPLLAVSAFVTWSTRPPWSPRPRHWFSDGACVPPETLATADEAAARHQTRVRAGLDRSRRHSWDFFSFAGFVPTAGARLSPTSRACVLLVDRSPRFIFVAESSVRREVNGLKRTGDYEHSLQLPGFAPAIDPARRDFSRERVDPALGFASCRVSGGPSAATPRARPRNDHQPPASAACDKHVRNLSAHGFDGSSEMAESQTKCFATRIPDSSLRCRFGQFEPSDVAGPYSVLGGW